MELPTCWVSSCLVLSVRPQVYKTELTHSGHDSLASFLDTIPLVLYLISLHPSSMPPCVYKYLFYVCPSNPLSILCLKYCHRNIGNILIILNFYIAEIIFLLKIFFFLFHAFHSTLWLWDLAMLLHVNLVHYFWLLYSTLYL